MNKPSALSIQVPADETVEIQLTADDLAALTRAAEAAQSADDARPSEPLPTRQPLAQRYAGRQIRRSPWKPVAKVAAATAAYAAFAWWSSAILADRQKAPSMLVARTPKVVAPQPLIPTAAAALPTVQVRNPFDATEIFEFPAGTSESEGREKVAQLLLARARERREQWVRNKAHVNLRGTNLTTAQN